MWYFKIFQNVKNTNRFQDEWMEFFNDDRIIISQIIPVSQEIVIVVKLFQNMKIIFQVRAVYKDKKPYVKVDNIHKILQNNSKKCRKIPCLTLLWRYNIYFL